MLETHITNDGHSKRKISISLSLSTFSKKVEETAKYISGERDGFNLSHVPAYDGATGSRSNSMVKDLIRVEVEFMQCG